MLNRTVVVLVAMLGLLAAACSGGDGSSDAATATSASDEVTTSQTAAPSESCSADSKDADELEELVADEVPSGFVQQPDEVGDTGPSNLAKAARDDSGEDALQVLTDLKFARGYQRLWSNESGDQLILFLYEFCDENGARDYLDRTRASFSSEDSLEPFAPSSAAVDEGYRGANEGVGFVTLPARAERYLVQSVAVGDSASVSLEMFEERATTLLEAQLATL